MLCRRVISRRRFWGVCALLAENQGCNFTLGPTNAAARLFPLPAFTLLLPSRPLPGRADAVTSVCETHGQIKEKRVEKELSNGVGAEKHRKRTKRCAMVAIGRVIRLSDLWI